MARKTPEDRGATTFHQGTTLPKPPATLPKAARSYWRQCVGAKPLGFWDPGTLGLLELYLVQLVAALAASNELRGEALGSREYSAKLRQSCMLTVSTMKLASRLRLTPQSRYSPRPRGILVERGAPKLGVLLGGKAVPH